MDIKTKKEPGDFSKERFSPEAARSVRDEISQCGGNEVFFVGRRDTEGTVVEVFPVARGNPEAVPAVTQAADLGDVVIHNHPTGVLIPSEADMAIASRLGGYGVGFYIVDNDASRVYAVVEPASEEPSPEPVDPEYVAHLLGPDGKMSRIHPNYEPRPSQCQMSADVTRILEEGTVGILEAGTGTGKSLAYLIPAVLWATRARRRVVISTRTINLQEQHLQQDLPLVREVLGDTFKAVLIKGRGNYLCLRKRDLIDTDSGDVLLEFDDVREVRELLQWSRITSDGTLSDLSFVPQDQNWNLLKAESDSCLRARCAHFSTCYFYRSRMEAASAQVLLANHHILFADLAIRSTGQDSASIMPRYDAVVLDEAHNVEDVALSYFDASVGKWGLMAQLGRLVSRRRNDRGLIPFLVKRAESIRSLPGERKEKMIQLSTSVSSGIHDVRGKVDRLFEDMAQIISSWLGSGKGGKESRWRIPPFKRDDRDWQEIDRLLGELGGLLKGTLTPLRKLNRQLKALLDDGFEELAPLWGDIAAVVSRLDASLEFLVRILKGETENEVFWVEVRRRRGRSSVNFHLTPLDAAHILKGTLFETVEPVVLTSATLTVGGSFQFISDRLGVDEFEGRRIFRQAYPSPFEMSTQMRLKVLDNLPEPGRDGFVEGLTQAVRELLFASDGGALVLFTSYRTLDAVYEQCLGELIGKGLPVARQGEAPRTVLLERFRAEPDMTLFATDSFWEGIDVVGESLRSMIIARLPFPVPTDPVVEARGEALIREGKDPFMEDSVPRAVIRLRQGVGRLIRHRDDRGVVAICDTRIIRRAYGKVFLDSFPGVDPDTGGIDHVAAGIREFFSANSAKG
ncbi:helicase [bacterium]|nr:MAG: helicase [bacterium]